MRGTRLVCSCLLVLAGAVPCSRADDRTELAQKARKVLETHCYRCHGLKAKGKFGYVLDFPRLRKRLVVAGEPEKSKLYQRVAIDKDMPPEDDDGNAPQRPQDAEIAVLSAWIKAGAPDFEAPVAPRKFISSQEVLERIAKDLRAQPEADRPFTRYFTLTHLYNAGVPEAQLQLYRLALAKLVNSLSWKKDLALPVAIDPPENTIFRIHLTHYGWDTPTWDRILAFNPYGIDYETETAKDIEKMARTPLPYVRGDWFVVRASQPPLYEDVLKLPQTEKELEEKVGIDVARDLRERKQVARAGFGVSGVSQNNRLVERHQTPDGAYWKSYDFSASAGNKNLFQHPLGPGGANGFVPDGGEIIFNLPNGLQAYLLVNAEGKRLAKAPTNIVLDKVRPDAAVVNGLSCMSCHAQGMIEGKDMIRQAVDRNADKYKDELEAVRDLYPGIARMGELYRKDAGRFAAAVRGVGGKLNKEGRIEGSEPISALAELFEEDINLALVAAEAGVKPEALNEALKGPDFPRALVVLGESGGTVKRDTFIDTFPDLVVALKLGKFVRPTEKPDPRVRPALPPAPRNPLRQVLPHESLVTAVAFTPDSRTLATGAMDGVVRFWDPVTGRQRGQLKEPAGKPVSDLAYSPDGKRLAVLSTFGGVSLWDPARPDGPLWKDNQHGDADRNHKRPLVFFPDGRSLASGDWKGKVIVWEAATGKVRRTLDFGEQDFVLSLAISPDGRVGAAGTSAGADKNAIRLWDTASGRPIRTLKTFDTVAAFSPDGRVLADGHRFWDWNRGEAGVELGPTWVNITAAAFTPDGKVLAVGGFDPLATDTVAGISLWDTKTGRPLGELEGPTRDGLSLAFSPDGRHLAFSGLNPQRGGKAPAWEVRVWALEPPHPPAGAQRGSAPQGDDEADPVKKYRERYKPLPRP